MIIYYAHAMSWYNTDREKADVEFLSQYGKVTNPNGKDWQDAVEIAKDSGYPVMQVFADYIKDWADVVAYRPFDDGYLGAGVAREVLEAHIWGKQVWLLYGGPVDAIHLVRNRKQTSVQSILTVAETRDRIAGKVL